MLKPKTQQISPDSYVYPGLLPLLRLSMKHWLSILKASLIFILAFVILKTVNNFFLETSGSGKFYFDFFVEILVALGLVFLWSCSLLATDNYLSEKKQDLRGVSWDIFNKFPRIFSAILIYVFIFLVCLVAAKEAHKISSILGLLCLFIPPILIFLY